MNTIDQTSMQFEPGAPAAQGAIPLCVPEIRGNEWKYIKECLDTGWVSSVGSYVNRFEQALAGYVGSKYAVAACSGTAALHIALLVSGIQPDDEVLVSALTFIAPVNACRYVGAWPVFIDAEPDYWQMDPAKVVEFLEHGCRWVDDELRDRRTGRRVKAILPVHILGHPVDMDPILEIAGKYDLVVIEDATESLGAKCRGRMVGTLGDIACFSFNGNKIITTGGGGMIVTGNEVWARKAKYLTTQAKDDPLEYAHNEIGYNYRLTNIQAAMGVAQLERLGDHVAAKRRIAAVYGAQLGEVSGVTPMREAPWADSVFWMYTVLVDQDKYGLSSRDLLRGLGEQRIQCRPLWQPIHQSLAHVNDQNYHCDIAERLNEQGISIPCSVGLTEVEQSCVIGAIRALARKNI